MSSAAATTASAAGVLAPCAPLRSVVKAQNSGSNYPAGEKEMLILPLSNFEVVAMRREDNMNVYECR